MQRILVNFARVRRNQNRGGGVRPRSLDEALVMGSARSADLVSLDEALAALTTIDSRKAWAVELRFFGGLCAKKTAEALKVS
jgi:hypothetical protein